MKSVYFLYFFFTSLAVHLISILGKWQVISHLTKPLLLVSLIVYFLSSNKMLNRSNTFFIAALVFSLMGDILLIFQNSGSIYFISGLGAFLLAHICFIIYFKKLPGTGDGVKWNIPVLAVIVVYGAGLLILLYPKLQSLKFPVTVYAATICIMLIYAIHLHLRYRTKATLYFAVGAALFVLSDSLLAINKFYITFTFASFGIMLTYSLAQWLLVSGAVSFTHPKEL